MNKVLLLFFLTVILLSCTDNGTEPEANLKIIISPIEQNIVCDSIAFLEIKVENASNLFAFSGEIHFDPQVAEVQSKYNQAGELWNSEALMQCINEPGCLNICIGLTQTDENDHVDGSGTLFEFAVKGINNGESDFTLSNFQLINENGLPIENSHEIEIINSILYVEN